MVDRWANTVDIFFLVFFNVFFKDFIFLFLERGEERERIIDVGEMH